MHDTVTRQTARSRALLASTVSAAALLWPLTTGYAQQLPTGGAVSAGSASISRPSADTLDINQSSNQAIINWQSFSVGAGSTVNFNQPSASSATLNRVLGSTHSSIAGTINARGTVLLVNPNGIAITKSGVIDTGSFAASTLDIKDSDFLAGKYSFAGTGASAAVVNEGRINVSDGGFVALLGGQVANDGVIAARLGKVGLGAGEAATLDLSGDGFLSVTVPSSELGKLVKADRALVSNKGRITADGGTVYLSAATAANALRNAVNIPGSVRTNTVGSRNGRIVINGGAGETVKVSGKLAANGRRDKGRSVAAGGRHSKGGSIAVAGTQIDIDGTLSVVGANAGTIAVKATHKLTLSGKVEATASAGKGGTLDLTAADISLIGALVDASGTAGGGTIEAGGGLRGGGSLAHALNVSVDGASTLRADALDNGNGGTIAVWSDGHTGVAGALTARGGTNGGDGGTIETSGHSVDFTGIGVNASAANGAAGTWLVDPTSLVVDSAAATTITNALVSGTNVTLQTNPDGTTSGPGTPRSGAGDIVFSAPIFAAGGSSSSATLTAQAYNDVVIDGGGTYISTSSSFAAQAGGAFTLNGGLYVQNLSIAAQRDMTFNGDLTVNGTATLAAGGNITFSGHTNGIGQNPVLNAGGNIQILAPTGTSAGATLNAYGNINVAANLSNFGSFGTGPVTLRADADGNGSGTLNFTNGAQFQAGGAPVTIYYNPASYTASTDFSSTVTGAGSVTPYMLVTSVSQLEAITNAPGGTYALGRDIDASGVNFTPIGWSGTTHNNFTGLFDGQGHVISNFTMGVLGSTQMPDRYFGGQAGLFGENDGTIRNLGVTGSIWTSLNQQVGALAGAVGHSGVISNSWSAVSVAGNNSSSYTGGLVGLNLGYITASYATGAVHGAYYVGGLVGNNQSGGRIDGSYATGAVDGQYAGGLVGWNRLGSLINDTYALGSVHGSALTGGLVGENEQSNAAYATIQNSYAAGHLTGSTIGGLVGENDYPMSENIDDFNAQIGQSAKVFWSTWDADTTGTYKAFGQSYLDKPGYASENTQYFGYTGAAACASSCPSGQGGYLGNSYQTASYNVFNDPVPGTNWTMQGSGFAARWYMIDGATRPFLSVEHSTTIQNSHQLQLIDMDGGASYTLARDIPYSNDGMWTSAGFSPIVPVTALNVETKTYGYFSFDIAIYTTQNQSGNNVVNTRVIKSPDSAYSVNGTLLSDTYSVTYQPTDFNGSLNGNGHTISNLTQSVTSGNTGLFYAIGSGATVQNLGIANPSIYADNHLIAAGSAGTVAGSNAGTIDNVWATGGGVNSWFAADVGGLVGTNSGTITRSYANVQIWGVDQAYDPSTGYPTSTFYDHDGGLVGTNHGRIANTYALGVVHGNGSVGGLVGYNDGAISNSYTTGLIGPNYGYGINSAGALVGNNQWGGVSNSFWDSSVATNQSGSGTGRSTTQLQDLNTFASTYTGWDFNHVWAPPNQAGQGGLGTAYYPQLFANAAVVFVQPSPASMTYGQSAPSLSTTVAGGPGVYQFDWLDSITAPSASSSATSTSGVNAYAITANVGTSLTSARGVAYRVVKNSGTLTVTPAPLTVTATSVQKTYGQTVANGSTGYSVSGLVNGDSVTSVSFNSTGLAANAAVDGGPYAITPSNAQGSGLGNYAIAYVNGTLTINPATLTYVANSASMTYGDTVPGLSGTVTGFVNNETQGTATTGTLAFVTSATSHSNVGNYAITGSGLTANHGNYVFTPAAGNATAFSITPALITVMANGGTSVYGSSPSDPRFTATGLKNSQDESVLTGLSNSFGIGPTTNVAGSPYTLSVLGTLTNPNYSITTRNTGTWTVTQAPLSITADDRSKVYGDTFSFTGSEFSSTGLQNGESIGHVDLTSTGQATTAGVAGGPYAIVANSATGGSFDIANYAVTYMDGNLAVTPAPVTVTANGGTSVYGSAPSDPRFTATGLKNSQDESVLTGLSNSFGIGPTTNVAGSPYTLSVLGTLTNPNYSITTRNTGTWTVTQAPLTITADDQSKVYGDTFAFTGGEFSSVGLQNGESIGHVDLTSGGRAATAGVAGGPYAIAANNATGGSFDITNYTVTYVDGHLTVTPAPITVMANGGTSVYGSSPSDPRFTATGLKNSQDESVLTGLSNSFGIGPTTNVAGSPYTLSVLGTLSNPNYSIIARNTGTWTVMQAPLTITADDQSKVYGDTFVFTGGEFSSIGLQNGESIGHVDLTSGGQANTAGVAGGPYAIVGNNAAGGSFDITNYAVTYVDGNLAVTPAPVTVTANGGTSVYGSSPSDPGFSATGLKNGQGESALTGLSNSFGIGPTTNVAGSPYTLSVLGTLTNPNYSITTRNTGTWTVIQAPLSITADDRSKVYGDTFSFTGSEFSSAGLQNGESIGHVDLTSTGQANTAGVAGVPYAIVANNAAGGSFNIANYAVTYVDGHLTVISAPITVAANGGTSVYGSSPSDPRFTATGLKNGQDESVLTGLSNSFGIGPTTNVAGSPYTLSVLGALANPNYSIIARNTGTWVVTPAPITVTANGGTSVYGSSPGNPGLSATGLQNGEGVGVLTGLSNSFGIGSTTNVAGSPYTLSVLGALTNQNYSIIARNTGTWTVTQAALAITADSRSKIYGDTFAFTGSEFSSTGLQNGESIGRVDLTSPGQVATASVAGGPYAIKAGGAAGGSFDIANYAVTYVDGSLLVTPAPVTVTASGGTSVYGSSPSNPGFLAVGLKNNEGLSTLTGLSNSFGITNVTGAGAHTLVVAGTLTNPNYAVSRRTPATWTVTPAQLIYIADPARRYFGAVDPAFGGTVTGFVNGETLATAITGALIFVPSATKDSAPGTYAINGTGLVAANYVFAQAPENASAFTITRPPTFSSSQFAPPVSNPPPATVTINFQVPGTEAVQPEEPAITGSLRKGRSYPPISEFDASQYTQFQIPDYAPQASQATVFTMIARAAISRQAANIDTFWDGKAADLDGTTGKNPVAGKVTFSDGASHDVTPGIGNGFPIVPGRTNFTKLLESGPVMIGGASGHVPTQWLLATGLSPDGKSILCNDPVTGKVVALSLDMATGAVGRIVGFYDPKSKGIVRLADNSGTLPAGSDIEAVMDFEPSTFFAVSIE